ncbi:hypothetical protein [Glaciihabitans sp. dw_435]|uniref:hypothetical protein n=1 Tax=Glaciihabitans sp. dw_435 TaxID=2720081 RepID=UPI001BD4072F|nr:hypothetical protein [Glaciihabitans sp. dw_435]
MRRWNPAIESERGSASLEFITAGVILLVPLVYLILALSSAQSGAMAAEGAARQAARVFVRGTSIADAQVRAERAVDLTLADYGIDPDAARVRISCAPVASDCLHRRGFVTVSVTARVPLPLIPAFGSDLPAGVSLSSSATQQVSRFWTAG